MVVSVRLGAFLGSLRSDVVVNAPLSRDDILALHANHSFVHIGGQHRGGTTLLSQAFDTHPLVSTMVANASGERTGMDGDAKYLHGEGVFLQDVYPRFMLDHPPMFFIHRRVRQTVCYLSPSLASLLEGQLPFLAPWVACRAREGIGSYALSPASHLGAEHPLANRINALRLLRQWASHWDLRRPVLIEKSPSNVLTWGLLRTMHAQLREASGAAAPAAQPHVLPVTVAMGTARFIFLTRHPVMQALAMGAFVDDLDLSQLVEHWLAVEESLRGEVRRHPGGSLAMLSLEGFTSRPRATVASLLAWIGVPSASAPPIGLRAGSGEGHEAAAASWGWDAEEEEEEEEGREAPPVPATPPPPLASEPLLPLDVDAAAAATDSAADGAEAELSPAAQWQSTRAAVAWLRAVRGEPNRRYAARYETLLAASADERARHEALVERFGSRVAEVSGYSLQDRSTYESRPQRSAEWWQDWMSPPSTS